MSEVDTNLFVFIDCWIDDVSRSESGIDRRPGPGSLLSLWLTWADRKELAPLSGFAWAPVLDLYLFYYWYVLLDCLFHHDPSHDSARKINCLSATDKL